MSKKTSIKKRSYHHLDAERFVAIWQSASNRAEVVKRYKHLNSMQVSSAATHMRRMGVKLKKFTPGKRARHSYAKLSKLAGTSK